ncbi:MAG: biotin--[acetyl-CoA-carboxylase] ligase [Candidatus Nitrosotenuis sp.]|nr:MAG: biotin--[acetyl-CoA-carboxylase] ligase [Candidatus Nitrosotenuis sp.]
MSYTAHENVGLIKVLQFLKAHHSEYLSGEDLSEVLKISRVAVWKHIKKIQALGYEIESKQNLGYRLTKMTDLMLPWEITDGLKTKNIGRKIYYFDTIDSTQSFASTIANNRAEDGTIIISETQDSGKGRLGRNWVSPRGGIWLSVILHPRLDIAKITLVPLVASIALSAAIQKTLDVKTELKWPNDVTLGGKKIAGMIIDASIESSNIESMILGVGINFRVNPAEIEKQIKKKENFYGVATLVSQNNKTKPAKLVQAFLEEFEKILDSLRDGKINKIVKDWTANSSTIGKSVTISTSNGKITGKAIKLDTDGGLIVMQKSKPLKIMVGDVSY